MEQNNNNAPIDDHGFGQAYLNYAGSLDETRYKGVITKVKNSYIGNCILDLVDKIDYKIVKPFREHRVSFKTVKDLVVNPFRRLEHRIKYNFIRDRALRKYDLSIRDRLAAKHLESIGKKLKRKTQRLR